MVSASPIDLKHCMDPRIIPTDSKSPRSPMQASMAGRQHTTSPPINSLSTAAKC